MQAAASKRPIEKDMTQWKEVEYSTPKRARTTLWGYSDPSATVMLDNGRVVQKRELPFDVGRLPATLRRRLNLPV